MAEWAGRKVGDVKQPPEVRLPPSTLPALEEPMGVPWAGGPLGFRPPSPEGGPWSQAASSAVHGLLSDPIDVLGSTPVTRLALDAWRSRMGPESVPALPTPQESSVRPLVGAGLERAGLPPDPPPTFPNLVTEGVAGGAGPGLFGRGARAAVRLGRTGLERAGLLGPEAAVPVARALETGPAVRLMRPLSSEPVVQGIAGGASGAAQSGFLGSDYPDWVKTLAPVGVGIGTGVGLRSGANLGRLIYAGSGSPGAAKTAAASAMLTGADKPAHALDTLLNYTHDPADPLAGFRTTAEVADQPGMYVNERTLRSSAGIGDVINHDAARQAEREAMLKPGGGSADDVAAFVAAERARRYGELDTAHADLGPAPDKIATPGEALQRQASELQGKSRTEYVALRDQLDPGNTSAIPTRPLRKLINARLTEEFGKDEALWPSQFKNINARLIEDGGNTTTLRTLDSIRQDAVSLANSPGADPKPKGVARDLSEAIAKHIDQSAALGQGVTAQDANTWNQMRVKWAQHKDTFGVEPVEAVTARRSSGTPEMGAYTVPGQFWQAGREGGNSMRAFNRIFYDPATGDYLPGAKDQLRAVFAHEVGSFVGPDGQLNRAELAAYIKSRKDAIGELKSPELRQQLGNLDKAQQLVEEYGTLQRSDRDASVNAASLFAQKDVKAALKEALSGSNSLRLTTDLVNQVRGSPVALEGLRNAYRELMAEHFTTSSPMGVGDQFAQSSPAAEKFFRKHSQVSEVLFAGEPEQQATLERLRRDFLSSNKWRTAGAAAGSNTAQYFSNFDLLNAHMEGSALPKWATPAQHMLLATLRSFGPIKNLMREGGERARAELIRAAMDPAAAADLFRAADPVTMERAIGRLRGINWAGVGARGVPGAVLQERRGREE